MGKSKFQISRSLDERIRRILGGVDEYDSEFAEVSSAYILGFNYGSVTNCVGLTTNYQLHHAVFPVVGMVFFRSSPNEEDIKSCLKTVKEYSFSPNGLGSFRSDKNEHLFLIYCVDHESKDVEKKIFNITKGAFAKRRRLRLNVLDDPYSPKPIQKGHSKDSFNLDDDDSMSSSDDNHFDHVIFFVHGVGGVCDVRFRSCVEVVADFRKMANSLLAQQSNASSCASSPTPNKHLEKHLKKGFFRKYSTDSSTSRASDVVENSNSLNVPRSKRVECIPVSWHSCTRKQTGLNDQLNLITLNSVPKLRHFLNKVVIDALLYASGPIYNQTIINNVGEEINRLYTLFMEKHPDFDGSISLAGHSLGSVILFDLLANQKPTDPSEHKPLHDLNTGLEDIKYPQLKFNPKCFFAFGSPTPMFLNVRGIQNISKDYKLPTCERMFNIFHPYDPLAYRIEPLIDPNYKHIDPVLIPHHRGGKRMHVQLREGFAKVGNDIKHRLIGSLRNTWTSFSNSASSSIEVEVEPLESIPTDTLQIGALNRGQRLDYVLQEKPIELFNEYIFAFTSHASYWQNEDSALIMLNQIYQHA